MAYRQLTCFFTCVFLFTLHTAAQDSLYRRQPMPIFISGSLFYDFPQSFGASAGAEFPLNSRHISIIKKGKQKEKYRDIITTSNIGFYRYAFNNRGLFLLQSVGYRYHKTKPYYFEWLLTFGALRTFYDGNVYSVDNYGTIRTLQNFGRLYAITGFTTVFGHDFERSAKPKPIAISIQPSLWVQYPYNSFLLPHFSIQLSFSYHFNQFNIVVHQKQIKRTHQT